MTKTIKQIPQQNTPHPRRVNSKKTFIIKEQIFSVRRFISQVDVLAFNIHLDLKISHSMFDFFKLRRSHIHCNHKNKSEEMFISGTFYSLFPSFTHLFLIFMHISRKHILKVCARSIINIHY